MGRFGIIERFLVRVLVTTLVVSTSAAFAQLPADIAKKYKAPLVVEKDDHLVLERYRVCQVSRPQALGGGESQPFRVVSRTQAPVGFMSHDNFVAFATEIGINIRVSLVAELVKGMTPTQALDALQCQDIPKVGAQMDFEADIRLGDDGLHIELVDKVGGRSKQAYPWNQIFGR